MGRFEDLYSKYAVAVFRYARSCVDRREVAEEIVSEAFMALHQKMDEVQDSHLPAWLLTVTKRRAADYWRRWFVEAKQTNWMVENRERSTAGDPEIPLALWLERSPQLKPIHRACLILRYAHGMTREEIAERLGLSDTQVKGHLQYSLELLRKDFQKPGSGGER